MTPLTVLEICAGGGGQSLGLEAAGFEHVGAVEIDANACNTLRLNRLHWPVVEGDIRYDITGRDYRGVDLLAGGVPCPPFSMAGRQLGSQDERDLFPRALELVNEARPAAVMLENVRGLAGLKFADYRKHVLLELDRLGYDSDWQLLNACDYGVPQLRPRFLLVALRRQASRRFVWPKPLGPAPTVGKTLHDLMSSRDWSGAAEWSRKADAIAPTIVGGSLKHGGPDLGPTRAKREWRTLGVDAMGIADNAPDEETPPAFIPKLTVRMVARLQGFPDDWRFSGRKTAAYRQVGNAFPPPVAEAVGGSIRKALTGQGPLQLALMHPVR